MKRQQFLPLITGVTLTTLLLLGCSLLPASAPQPESPTVSSGGDSISTPQPNVSFDSNVGVEFTGVTISFGCVSFEL